MAAREPPEHARLRRTLAAILKVDDSDAVTYYGDPKVAALRAAGITGWTDFISCSKQDIVDLTVPDGVGGHRPLPLMEKRKLTILLALYHKICGDAKKLLSPLGLTKKRYDDFCMAEY